MPVADPKPCPKLFGAQDMWKTFFPLMVLIFVSLLLSFYCFCFREFSVGLCSVSGLKTQREIKKHFCSQ